MLSIRSRMNSQAADNGDVHRLAWVGPVDDGADRVCILVDVPHKGRGKFRSRRAML